MDIPVSPAARRTLDCASQEADRVRSPHIDTEHVLLGLLQQPESTAAEILASKGVRLDEVREEIRLRSQARETPGRPESAFSKLAVFLRQLEDRRARYYVLAFRQDAIRVEVALPEKKWMITFFEDGRVAIERYSPAGSVEEDEALARLLDELGPSRETSG